MLHPADNPSFDSPAVQRHADDGPYPDLFVEVRRHQIVERAGQCIDVG
jgi:hypothetical protein